MDKISFAEEHKKLRELPYKRTRSANAGERQFKIAMPNFGYLS